MVFMSHVSYLHFSNSVNGSVTKYTASIYSFQLVATCMCRLVARKLVVLLLTDFG